MRKLHKKPLVLAAAAIALTGSLTVGSAMAYVVKYAMALPTVREPVRAIAAAARTSGFLCSFLIWHPSFYLTSAISYKPLSFNSKWLITP